MITDAFADLDRYIGLPRVSGLCLAPDGARLAVAVATPDSGNSRYITALWEVDPRGVRPVELGETLRILRVGFSRYRRGIAVGGTSNRHRSFGLPFR